MTDPSGPTMAKDPDDLSNAASSDDPAPAVDRTPDPEPPAAAGPASSETVVDATGTVEVATPATEGGSSAPTEGDPAAPAVAEPPPVEAPAVEAPAVEAPAVEVPTAGTNGEAEVKVPVATGPEQGAEPPVDGGKDDDGAKVADGRAGDGDADEVRDEDEGGIDDEDDFDEDEQPGEGRRRGGLLTRQIQVDARLILICTVVLALAVGAYILGQRQGRDMVDSAAPRSPTTTVFTPPKDFVPFEDPETGVKLSVPKDWTRYSTKDLDPAIRLAVGIPNTSDTVVVRVNAFSSEVTKANIGDQKNVFDQLMAGEKIEILVNQVSELRGLPALFYVYRFTDEPTGVKGYHAHYFVFQGRKMVSVIFQALPEARYAVLAPVFDQIASTLEVTPGEPPAFLNPIGEGATGAPGPATSAPGAAPTPSTTPAPPTTG